MIPTPTSEPTICHEPHVCRDCGDAIHDGNTCIECWRDRRYLAMERDREWWA
jgi:hypothetical protein